MLDKVRVFQRAVVSQCLESQIAYPQAAIATWPVLKYGLHAVAKCEDANVIEGL